MHNHLYKILERVTSKKLKMRNFPVFNYNNYYVIHTLNFTIGMFNTVIKIIIVYN